MFGSCDASADALANRDGSVAVDGAQDQVTARRPKGSGARKVGWISERGPTKPFRRTRRAAFTVVGTARFLGRQGSVPPGHVDGLDHAPDVLFL
jgi:hypothetical protein